MATSALVSTVVMGSVLLAIVALVLRLRGWQHPTASVGVDAGGFFERLNGPLGWSVVFFVVTFGLMGLGMVYIAGGPVAGIDQATLGLLVLGAVAVVVGGAGVIAVYGAVKSRGLNSAQAAGLSSVLLATLLLVAIVIQLFVGG